MGNYSFTYKFSAIVLMIVAGLVVQSCESRGTDMASVYGPPPTYDPNNMTFEVLSAAVLVPQCIKCHGEFSSPVGVAAEIVPGDPDHSPLYLKVADGEMPKGGTPLRPSLVQMVRAYIDSLNPGPSDPPIDLNHVTFQVLRDRIFAPRCAKCHQDDFATPENALVDIEPGDPDHSILYNFVASGKMPKDGVPLSSNYVEAIRAYIQTLPPKTYPPIAPTWTSINANLIQRSCIQCHRPGGMAEDVPFDTYAGVASSADMILKKIQNQKRPMPPRNTTLPPDPQLIQTFSDWMKAGEPQN